MSCRLAATIVEMKPYYHIFRANPSQISGENAGESRYEPNVVADAKRRTEATEEMKSLYRGYEDAATRRMAGKLLHYSSIRIGIHELLWKIGLHNQQL